MTPTHPWRLAEATWPEVTAARYQVAILPWGATEPHNRHLPYATDNIQAEQVADACAARAWGAGARVVVLPTVPYGVQTTQLDLPLAMNLNPSTQALVLREIVESVTRAGITKFVLFNGHGGNDFKQMIRELQPQTTTFLCTLNWWQVGDAASVFDDLGDHAGELETSVMLHHAPTLVRPLSEAGPGRERKPRIPALRERWVWAPRPWSRVTEDTGIGDPKAATAAKGATYSAQVCERISAFLVDLAAAELTTLYDEESA